MGQPDHAEHRGLSRTLAKLKLGRGGTWLVFGVPLIVLLIHSPGPQAVQPPARDFREAISLAVAGEYESALALFRSELSKDPDDPLANYYVGMTQFKLERFEASTVYFEKAIERGAPFPQAYFWLAKAYLETEKERLAIAILKKGLGRFPDNQDLLALGTELGVGPQ